MHLWLFKIGQQEVVLIKLLQICKCCWPTCPEMYSWSWSLIPHTMTLKIMQRLW